jgi:hypothetical protein
MLLAMKKWLFALSILVCTTQAHAQSPPITTSQCLTANEQSIVLEKERHLQSARKQAVSCAASSCPVEVREECARRVSHLSDAVPTLVLDVKDDRGNDVTTAVVKIDGEIVAQHIDGAPLTIDPGDHALEVDAEGSRPQTKRIVVREGEKNRAERIVLVPIAKPFTPPPPVASRKHSPVVRGVGYALIGVGIVGLGIGSYFGLSAASAWSDSQKQCSTAHACDPSGHDAAVAAHDDATSKALISTLAFAASGVALVGGAVLIFAAPVVTPKSAGIDIGLRF